MKLLAKLERKLGNYAIPNLTLYLVTLQGLTFFLSMGYPGYFQKIVLTHDTLFAGQWWRLFTMLVTPPATHPLFLILFLYFMVLVGNTLEAHWGTFRYNIYILIGYLATLLVALIPGASVSNFYLMESIFLAFAWLYPEMEIFIFFVLPVKMKWLGLATWIWFAFAFVSGPYPVKAEVAAGTLNFLLFFYDDLFYTLRTRKRRFTGQIARAQTAPDLTQPMHVCAECGVSDLSDKKMEFRYCPQCTGTPAYCINHIQNHQHR
jgi:hypothetical protein